MNSMVLGGTGFLGMNLIRMLESNGNHVTVFGHASSHMERLKVYEPEVDIIESKFDLNVNF